MTADKVLDLYKWLKQNGIAVWVDGGWCIDALIGKETREHLDLDVAVEKKNNAKLRELLETRGYQEEKRNDSSEFMYFMKNDEGQGIDVHAFGYDENGKNIYGIEYPFGSLTGRGTINGQEVNCIDPEWMFKFKTSYEPKDKDVKDVQALSAKFGFELPERYRRET